MTESIQAIDQLFLAVVQAQDGDLVETLLEQESFVFGRLPSTGGFLRERSVTFLIGCGLEKVPTVKSLLLSAARKRVTYISTPLENAPLPFPIPAETMIGGVTLFTLDLDHYEEF